MNLIDAARAALPILQAATLTDPDAKSKRDALAAAIVAHDTANEKPDVVVNRLLGLADQFMEDWADTTSDDDTEYQQRQAEWDLWRPRIVKCVEFTYRTSTIPAMLLPNVGTAVKLRNFAKDALK